MKTVITAVIGILIKVISVENVAKVLAFCVSKLLGYASRKGGDAWDKTKAVMVDAENWIHLFNETYEDDEMTPEEEAKVAEAIKNLTSVKKVAELVKKAKA